MDEDQKDMIEASAKGATSALIERIHISPTWFLDKTVRAWWFGLRHRDRLELNDRTLRSQIDEFAKLQESLPWSKKIGVATTLSFVGEPFIELRGDVLHLRVGLCSYVDKPIPFDQVRVRLAVPDYGRSFEFELPAASLPARGTHTFEATELPLPPDAAEHLRGLPQSGQGAFGHALRLRITIVGITPRGEDFRPIAGPWVLALVCLP